jgi:hypothetical protein
METNRKGFLMQVFETDQVICCDVDDTLLMWSNKYTQPHEGAIAITDPYDGSVNYLIPHKRHVELIKKQKGRGLLVIVWSAAGVLWAEAAVKALELESFVDIVLTKPSKYIDDLPVQEWMGDRIYIPFDKK